MTGLASDGDLENTGKRPPLVAFTTDDGFEIAGLTADLGPADEIRVLTYAGETLDVSTKLEFDADRIMVKVGDIEKMANAAILELRSGSDVIAYAIAHHLEELRSGGGDDAHRAFQRSFATLNTDSPMPLHNGSRT